MKPCWVPVYSPLPWMIQVPQRECSRILQRRTTAFEIKALSVGGELLPADQIDALAKLPTRDEALSLLMAVMQAPVTKLVEP